MGGTCWCGVSLQGLEQEVVVLVPCRLPYKKTVLGNLWNCLALVLAGVLSQQGEEVPRCWVQRVTRHCSAPLSWPRASLTVTVGKNPSTLLSCSVSGKPAQIGPIGIERAGEGQRVSAVHFWQFPGYSQPKSVSLIFFHGVDELKWRAGVLSVPTLWNFLHIFL